MKDCSMCRFGTYCNPFDFVTEQVFFASKDGVKIPMFLTYKKDLKKDGKK